MDLEVIHTNKEDTIQAIIFIREKGENLEAKVAAIFRKNGKETICLNDAPSRIDPVYPENHRSTLTRIEKGIHIAICPKSFKPESIEVIAYHENERASKEIQLI